ncbi:MAG: TRAP transporter large permease [Chloroflexi bacterium]|nr:TRAP transporter large permease [Chloroflexota bacterium]
MEWWQTGIILFAGLFLLLVIGVPVGFSLCTMAVAYALLKWGFGGLITFTANSFSTVTNYLLIAAPLFILMGELISASGLATRAFKTLDHWLGFIPGRLAVVTVLTQTVLAAATGFGSTGIVAIGPMVLPEMLRRKYDQRLAIGALAGGSALGVLIPPSVPFIVYAFFANESVAALFFAGIIPGILASLLFVLYIVLRAVRNPSLAPAVPSVSWSERLRNTPQVLPLLFLIMAILGVIWFGIATPTEAAGVGAVVAMVLLIAFVGTIKWSLVRDVLLRTVQSTTMVYIIIIGAFGFTQALTTSGFITNFAEMMTSFAVPIWVIVALMMLVNLVLGCFLDSMGVLALSLPIYVPIVKALGLDMVWFGVLIVVNTEIGSLTPPVGVATYFLKSIAPDYITLEECFRGTMPYWFLYLFVIVLVAIFPSIALWLPSLMGK